MADHKKLLKENHWVSGVVVVAVLFAFVLYVHQHRKGTCRACADKVPSGGSLPKGVFSSNIVYQPEVTRSLPLLRSSGGSTVSSLFAGLTAPRSQ